MKISAKDRAELLREARQELAKAGGSARAKTLTAERRKEIAKKAATARWGKKAAGKK